MVEQLSLFGDENILFNTGLQHLLEMNFDRCLEALKNYGKLFPWGRDNSRDIAVAEFWLERLEGMSLNSLEPEQAEQCWRLWTEFEDTFGYPWPENSIEKSFQVQYFSRIADGFAKNRHAQGGKLTGGTPTGLIYLLAGRPDPAIASLQALIAAEPDHARAYGYLGDAYALRGDLRTARMCYREAFALAPDQVDTVHLQDSELRRRLKEIETDERVEGDPVQWFPATAQLEGFFEPRNISNFEDIKAWVKRYLDLVKTSDRHGERSNIPALFYHAMVLSDNASMVRFIKKVDLIGIRKNMKAWHPVLFADHMKALERKDPGPRGRPG